MPRDHRADHRKRVRTENRKPAHLEQAMHRPPVVNLATELRGCVSEGAISYPIDGRRTYPYRRVRFVREAYTYGRRCGRGAEGLSKCHDI